MLQKHVEIYWKFGEGTVSDRTCRRWYEKFETGDFDLSDKPRSGRPSLIDDDVVKAMLEQDPFLTTSEIAERLNSAQQTISDHIRKIGLVWKYSRWVLHELSQKNLDDRVVICTSLACSEQNRALFEPDDNWGWKVDYIQQHCKEKGILWTRKT